MFILVLQQCHKENEDKWKRLSRQIADVILPMIAKQQVGNHLSCVLVSLIFFDGLVNSDQIARVIQGCWNENCIPFLYRCTWTLRRH